MMKRPHTVAVQPGANLVANLVAKQPSPSFLETPKNEASSQEAGKDEGRSVSFGAARSEQASKGFLFSLGR